MRKSCSLNIGTNGYCSKRHGVGSEQISPIQISPKQITKFHPHWHHLIPVNRIVKPWVNEKILPIEECSTLSLPNIRQQQRVVRAYVSPIKTSTKQISVIQIREPLTRKLNVSTYSDTCSVPGDTPWKLTASEKILYIEEGNKLLSAPRGNSGDRTNIYCTMNPISHWFLSLPETEKVMNHVLCVLVYQNKLVEIRIHQRQLNWQFISGYIFHWFLQINQLLV